MTLLSNPEFWVALGFIAVLAIFVWRGVPGMIANLLDARATVIRAELDEARRLREEAASLLASYKAKAQSAEEEAERILTGARTEADRLADEARRQLQEQLTRRAQVARDRIAQAEAQAMAEIRALAAETAAGAAESLIAAHLGPDRASVLVQQSVAEISQKLG
ncbi:MAG: F0F1 ATP synthase subunit B [Alphaproteobacteria bacterium]|nr:F0F1 ATP synthase subunit B [Alphaproteobacteria bacterium]